MKLPCNTVQDLLPLYQDRMCSPETRAMIDGHLKTCEACTRELGLMEAQTPAPLPHPDEAKIAQAAARTLRQNRWKAVLGIFRRILLGLLLCEVLLEHFADIFFVGGFYNGYLTVSTIPLALFLFALEEILCTPRKAPADWAWIGLNLMAAVHIPYALNIHHGILGCTGNGIPTECGLNVAWGYVIPWLVLLFLRQCQLPKDGKHTWDLTCICLTLATILIFTVVRCIRFENFSLTYLQQPALTWATYGFLLWMTGKLVLASRWMVQQVKETVRGQD